MPVMLSMSRIATAADLMFPLYRCPALAEPGCGMRLVRLFRWLLMRITQSRLYSALCKVHLIPSMRQPTPAVAGAGAMVSDPFLYAAGAGQAGVTMARR